MSSSGKSSPLRILPLSMLAAESGVFIVRGGARIGAVVSQNPLLEDMDAAALTPFMTTVPKGRKPMPPSTKPGFKPEAPKKQFTTPKGKSK